MNMAKQILATVDKPKQYLLDKKYELIWALSLQDYNYQDIADIFNLNRSTIMRIVRKRPYGWTPKWRKVAL